jgi:hypothetical protein
MEISLTILTQALATFLGNFLLLYLIGVQARKAELKQVEFIENYRKKIQEEMTKRSEQMKKYVELES